MLPLFQDCFLIGCVNPGRLLLGTSHKHLLLLQIQSGVFGPLPLFHYIVCFIIIFLTNSYFLQSYVSPCDHSGDFDS